MKTRIEKDSMGEMRVPADALYGAQTARAVENFPISGQGIGREMIQALGTIKRAAAQVNQELGLLDRGLAEAIAEAARQVADGDHDRHFPVDVFQTGSGTSSNMNANEVIANLANLSLGAELGSRKPVHPNDHVNLGQSSNDVFPSALRMAALALVETDLLPSLRSLEAALSDKAAAFADIVKAGRTHLQDATPLTLGQEFSGFASQIAHGLRHLEQGLFHLREMAIGGTAVGTGINTHPEFGARMARALSELSGLELVEAPNHFEAQAAQDAAVAVSGALKTLAVSLLKMANDIRFLGSGPRLGLGELEIPAVQPGSSIMPGKVNPVMAEALIQVAAQVLGNDTAINLGGLYGNFQLNVMQPLLARNLLEQIRLLSRGADLFRRKLVEGLAPRREHIAEQVQRSLMLATALAPRLGYDVAAEIAKQAHARGLPVKQVAREMSDLTDDDLEELLNPRRMV